jgi:hypothetical protein
LRVASILRCVGHAGACLLLFKLADQSVVFRR